MSEINKPGRHTLQGRMTVRHTHNIEAMQVAVHRRICDPYRRDCRPTPLISEIDERVRQHLSQLVYIGTWGLEQDAGFARNGIAELARDTMEQGRKTPV